MHARLWFCVVQKQWASKLKLFSRWRHVQCRTLESVLQNVLIFLLEYFLYFWTSIIKLFSRRHILESFIFCWLCERCHVALGETSKINDPVDNTINLFNGSIWSETKFAFLNEPMKLERTWIFITESSRRTLKSLNYHLLSRWPFNVIDVDMYAEET